MEPSELIELVESILEVKPGSVALESNLKELEWDSLADIGFIAAVDDKLGVELDPMSLAACETVNDLYALVTESVAAK